MANQSMFRRIRGFHGLKYSNLSWGLKYSNLSWGLKYIHSSPSKPITSSIHLQKLGMRIWSMRFLLRILHLQSSLSPSPSPLGKISLYGSPILNENIQLSLSIRLPFTIPTAAIILNPTRKIYGKLNSMSASKCSYGGSVPTPFLQR